MRLSLSTYCTCGGELVVAAYSMAACADVDATFREWHQGDGHALFPTEEEAQEAAEAAS